MSLYFDLFCKKSLPVSDTDKDILYWYCDLKDYSLTEMSSRIKQNVLKYAKIEYSKTKEMYDKYTPLR